MGINGAQLVSKCPIGRPLVAAKGFFDLFYRWNRIGCGTSRKHATNVRPLQCPFTKLLFPSAQHGRRAQSTSSSASAFPSKATQLPRSNTSPEPPLSTSLRTLMRTLPHSVVVLTTSASTSTPTSTHSKSPHEYEYKGMTLSSFTTLTLTPSPIITFNIRHPSQTLSALKSSKLFLIHMLEGTKEGAGVADTFTRGNSGTPFEGLEIHEKEVGGKALPRIHGKGVGRVLVCEVNGQGFVEVGDHVVVIAGVKEILYEDGEKEGKAGLGLCYVDGRYRGVGGVLEIERGDNRTKM